MNDIFALRNKFKELHSVIDNICDISESNFVDLYTRVEILERENQKLKERNMKLALFLNGMSDLLKEDENC